MSPPVASDRAVRDISDFSEVNSIAFLQLFTPSGIASTVLNHMIEKLCTTAYGFAVKSDGDGERFVSVKESAVSQMC